MRLQTGTGSPPRLVRRRATASDRRTVTANEFAWMSSLESRSRDGHLRVWAADVHSKHLRFGGPVPAGTGPLPVIRSRVQNRKHPILELAPVVGIDQAAQVKVSVPQVVPV